MKECFEQLNVEHLTVTNNLNTQNNRLRIQFSEKDVYSMKKIRRKCVLLIRGLIKHLSPCQSLDFHTIHYHDVNAGDKYNPWRNKHRNRTRCKNLLAKYYFQNNSRNSSNFTESSFIYVKHGRSLHEYSEIQL